MPISPQAIKAFLARRGSAPPSVKKRPRAWLERFIEDLGGIPCQFKNEPRQAQLEGWAFALWARQSLLYYDPRTGKTGCALYWLDHLKKLNQFKRCLIIAHAPIGVEEWQGQYRLYCDLDLAFVTSEGNAFDELCEAIEANHDAIVIAWSTLQAIFSVKRPNKKGAPKLYVDREKAEAIAPFFDALIIDEIHKSMNPGSLTFSIAEALVTHCDWRMGLTGTPFGRDPYGLWAQAFLIDEGKALSSNYYFFEPAFGKEKYNPFTKTKKQYVFDKDKMDILRDKLAHMTLFCKLSEVQDLDVMKGRITLQMNKQQKIAYNAIIDKVRETGIKGLKQAENIFVNLRQISSGYRTFVDDYGNTQLVDFLSSPKMEWLEEFVSELGPETKCLIVHEYTHTGEMIVGLLKKLKVKYDWLYGATKDRPALKERFQKGDTQFLVMNWQTGGTAIDLSAADYLLFYESPAGFIARKQTEARPMARGNRTLILDDMVCSPVEANILDFHSEGRELNDLLEGNVFTTLA